MQRTWIAVLLAALAATACSSPPKVRDCEGEFHPINANASGQQAALSAGQSIALCMKGNSDGEQG